jgi:hypothetical protein
LRTLLILVVLGAIFSSYAAQRGWFQFATPPIAGTWELQVNRHIRRAKLVQSKDGTFVFSGSTVFAGVYDFQGNKLIARQPNDRRMLGLIWEWQGNEWKLIAEPLPPPTGSTYVGSRLYQSTKESARMDNQEK